MYQKSLADKLVFKSYGGTAVGIIFNHLNVLAVTWYNTDSSQGQGPCSLSIGCNWNSTDYLSTFANQKLAGDL